MIAEETRTLILPEEYRVKQEGDDRNKLVGYACLWNVLSQPIWDPETRSYFVERLMPGCFTRSLQDHPDVKAFVAHNKKKILGRVSAGTLQVAADEMGLKFELDLPGTTYARDLKESVGRKDLDGVSFGFKQPRATFERSGKYPVRTVHEAILTEVSPGCENAAYLQATAELRTLADHVSTPILDTYRRRARLVGVDVRK